MKKLFPFILTLLVILSACKENEKPNIILVITDDQGYGDLACHGNPVLQTPNIDKLHGESVRLTDFHVTSTCSPTRGALLTGHYTNRAGSWHTISSREMVFDHEVMLSQVLKENGYSTAIFGKWHLGDNHPFRPQDNGYEESFIHKGGGVGQSPDYWLNNYFDDTYFRNGEPQKVKGYCTDVWFDNAMEYIERKTDEGEPFFCYLSTNAPHGPFYVPDKYRKMYEGKDDVVNAAFNGMITNIDDNMGKLMKFMDDKGISNNTILIFMTDNGAGNGSGFTLDKNKYVKTGYNAGMRGGKVSMYEGGHRVPFIIRWPAGGIKGGIDVADLTAHIDIFPTFVEALALKGTEKLDFDGVSLLGLLTGKKKKLKERVIITDTQRNMKPEKWKMSSTMKDKWRLINGKQLYNIETDSEQRNDVSEANPELVAELRAAYETWWSDIEPVFDTWQAITLCDSTEQVTVLCSHDLLPDDEKSRIIWKQEHLREQIEKYKATGWYNVKVPEAGKYKFTLMRYPPEAGLALNASASAAQKTPGTNAVPYKEAVALPIEKAFIQIDNNEELVAEVDPNLSGYSFEINVEKGLHKLRTHFAEADEEKYTAMYVQVEKVK